MNRLFLLVHQIKTRMIPRSTLFDAVKYVKEIFSGDPECTSNMLLIHSSDQKYIWHTFAITRNISFICFTASKSVLLGIINGFLFDGSIEKDDSRGL